MKNLSEDQIKNVEVILSHAFYTPLTLRECKQNLLEALNILRPNAQVRWDDKKFDATYPNQE